jgi:hypothetical protein
MRNILLVALLVMVLAVSSVASFAAAPGMDVAPAPLAVGTPIPTPEQPPDIEEDWVWTTGCIVQTYGNSAPWTFKIWFQYLGKFGYYGPTYIYYYAGTKVIAKVYPGGNPVAVESIMWNGSCNPNGEPIG